jgi:hypothetical protein
MRSSSRVDGRSSTDPLHGGRDRARAAGDPAADVTQSPIDHVIEVVLAVAGRAGELGGLRIVAAAPTLRYFTARFEPAG